MRRRRRLGVVSGTGLPIVLAKRLQRGDADADRALDVFPVAGVARELRRAYPSAAGLSSERRHRLPPKPEVLVTGTCPSASSSSLGRAAMRTITAARASSGTPSAAAIRSAPARATRFRLPGLQSGDGVLRQPARCGQGELRRAGPPAGGLEPGRREAGSAPFRAGGIADIVIYESCKMVAR